MLRGADWPEVQSRLHEVLVAARVVEVNASKRSQALDYDQGGEHGVTVIAVGGFSLSRGLTLEGLTVSYFLRNSMMYDTLMQMGRWFGYRPGYEDLCRVWMPGGRRRLVCPHPRGDGRPAGPAEADGTGQGHARAVRAGSAQPPGIADRDGPQQDGDGPGVSDEGRAGRQAGRDNADTLGPRTAGPEPKGRAKLWWQPSRPLGLAEDHPSRGTLYRSVPVDLIRDFLRVFRADAADPLTDPRLMSDYIDARADGELKEWDVLFASAQKADAGPDDLAGIEMRAFGRSVGEADLRQGVLAISGTSRRVGSPGDERVGLTPEQIDAAV